MNTFHLVLDLDKSQTRQPPTVIIRRGDADGTTIVADICDHGEPTDLSATTSAAFVMLLPDNAHYYRKTAVVDGGTLSVTVDEAEAASVLGRASNAYFCLSLGGSDYSTSSFSVLVLPDATDDASAAQTYDSYVQAAIDDATAAAAAAWQAAQQTIPDSSVTTVKLADSAVTLAKMDASVRMTALTNAEIDVITEGGN